MSANYPVENIEKAVQKLKEVLSLEKTEIHRDSAIKRFEICFDLVWKSMKAVALKHGIECNSPRLCFKTAFQLKLIDYEEAWLKMIEDRNTVAHIYNEEYADQVYSRLEQYLKMFEKFISLLKGKQD